MPATWSRRSAARASRVPRPPVQPRSGEVSETPTPIGDEGGLIDFVPEPFGMPPVVVAAPIPVSDRVLFRLQENQVKVFNRDLELAGIEKRDDRGRIVCIHSLRNSFATMLGRSGTAPRVAQAAMRHSSLDMTQVYTDPRLMDVAAALEQLPKLVLQHDAT